jgi:hypothetical protein
MSKSESRWALLWAVIVVGLTCLPYLVAWRLAPEGTHYTGLLVNHFDGESYYAKMQQGARSDWLFHLPFTAEPHQGAFIFTFYLALGHLSSALSLPLPLTYHLARVATGIFMLLVAYRFIARFFDRVPTRRAAFLLLAFSAGLGWLLASLGLITADLWVAEGFTFLSILVNPHFPLAIGLMLLIFIQVLGPSSSPSPPTGTGTGFFASPKATGARPAAGCGVCGLVLAMVQPFAVPIVLAILAVYLTALAVQSRRPPWREILLTGIVVVTAAPVMIYDFYVYRTNPALAAWSAQNLTASLPPWNYALGYGLILILALAGIPTALRRRRPTDLLLIAWIGSAVLLLYLPFALQRRFITGLHVPLALLAAMGLEQVVWPRVRAQRRALVTGLIVALSALTSLLVPLIAVAGVAQGQPPLVMSSGEAAAWSWLKANTSWTDTVLAPVDSGEFIPAWAGNRVVYGHPFETIDAKAKEAEVARFYSPEATVVERRAMLDRYGVRYVFLSPRDLAARDQFRADAAALGLVPAWTGSDAVLYRVEAEP